jgi:MFS family permease
MQRTAVDYQSSVRTGELSRKSAVWPVAADIAVMFGGSTLLTPLYVIYQQQFGFTKITLTLVYAAYVVGNLVALFLFGGISDRIGRRAASLPALAAACVATLLYLSATSIIWLFLARTLTGIAVGIASGTATAWLAELYGENQRARATVMATTANFVGISLGALVAGVLAQYAPWPLHLSFIVYLAAVIAVMVLIWRTPETVARRGELGEVSLKPQIGLPRDIRVAFIAPAATAFSIFALVGFYAALAPTLLVESLAEANHAVAGGVVFELCIVAALAMVLTRLLRSRTAMLSSLVLLLPSVVLLVAAQALASIPVLLVGVALAGVAIALGYRGSLQVVNEIAPKDRRAEVLSSYMLACFTGNTLPVIGVGILATLVSPLAATVALATMIALFAIVALFMGAKYGVKV